MKRGEVKAWKPKKSEAFNLCEDVYGRHCGCRIRHYPCFSWRNILLDCAIWGFKDARAAGNYALSDQLRKLASQLDQALTYPNPKLARQAFTKLPADVFS